MIRNTLRFILRLATLLLMGSLALIWLLWLDFCENHGIQQLDWQNLHFTNEGTLQLDSLILKLAPPNPESYPLQLTLHNLQLRPTHWWVPWRLEQIQVQQIELHLYNPLQTAETQMPPVPPLPDRKTLEQWLQRLPHHLQITNLRLQLPCATGHCLLQLGVDWQRGQMAIGSAWPAQLQLHLQKENHQAQLVLKAQPQAQHLQVELAVHLDQVQRLHSYHRLKNSTDGQLLHWGGSLAMAQLPEAPWLLEWLTPWLGYTPPSLPTPPDNMRWGASWSLSIPRNQPHNAHGQLSTALNLPVPWPLLGLGQLQGQLTTSLKRSASHAAPWLPASIEADLHWHPSRRWLQRLPSFLHSPALHLQLSSTKRTEQTTTALQLQAHLQTQTPVQLDLQIPRAELTLEPFQLDIPKAHLRLDLQNLPQAELGIRRLRGELQLTAQLNQKQQQWQLGQGSYLQANNVNLTAIELKAQRLQINLQDLRATTNLRHNAYPTHLQLPLQVQVQRLQHPLLIPQNWTWQGHLGTQNGGYQLEGQLRNVSDFQLQMKARQTPTQQWQLEGQLAPLNLAQINPLAQTFRPWPSTLSFQDGQLHLQGKAQLSKQRPLEASLQLQAQNLEGIQDRLEIHGLNAKAQLQLRKQHLHLEVPYLNIQRLNPGINLGPVSFQGHYSAPLEQLQAGQLSWRKAQLEMFGGRIWSDALRLQLGQPKQEFDLQVRQLNLGQLLKAYPVEGLEGSGLLDGELHVQLENGQLSIPKGQLQARYPDRLKFASARMQALARTNPAMDLVSQALQNFRYDQLRTNLRYTPEGLLYLALQLHGRNPQLQEGRPINFNINLEENIPNLLTSLQLSDRVSETIQQRVRERLENPAP